MREILMNEEEFRNLIEDCLDYIFYDNTYEDKKNYWNELFGIMNISDEQLRWAKFIASHIFRDAIGEWEKIDGFCLWVKD